MLRLSLEHKTVACTYYKYIRARAKADGVPTTLLPTISKPARQCFACGYHLCRPRFNVFHLKEDMNKRSEVVVLIELVYDTMHIHVP
jgi:hypothetical protein